MATRTKTFKLKITNCTQCPNHEVLRDPDPFDSFNSDDVKVVCKATNKNITVACRPYMIEKECAPIPKWCPL